jgi:hypothetical protein
MIEVTDPAAEADARIGRREGYLSMSTSDNATTLQRAGTTALASAAAEDQARSIAVVHGPASEGQFEPWVDYREGDWISLDADGSGGVAVPRSCGSRATAFCHSRRARTRSWSGSPHPGPRRARPTTRAP